MKLLITFSLLATTISAISGITYKVHIYTADEQNASTICDVMMRVNGTAGVSKIFKFKNDILRRKFGRGSVETYSINITNTIGAIQSINIGHDDRYWPSTPWKAEKVIIESPTSSQKYEFSINKWLENKNGRTNFISTQKKLTDCGTTSSQPRVVNGATSKKGQWPWQAQLKVNTIGHWCGGTLIHPQFVLTASHCLYQIKDSEYRMDVILGEHNLTVTEGTEQIFKNNELFLHPNWDRPTVNNDIALIKLSRPALLNSNVKLACLPQRNEVLSTAGTPCYVSGWGKMLAFGTVPSVLQHAYLPSVEQYGCLKKMRNINPNFPVNENMVCGGGNQKSGCHGDSGGPYVCRNRENKFAVHGAVSWGSPMCDTKDAYTVFSRVTRYLDWIESYIYNTKYITKDKF